MYLVAPPTAKIEDILYAIIDNEPLNFNWKMSILKPTIKSSYTIGELNTFSFHLMAQPALQILQDYNLLKVNEFCNKKLNYLNKWHLENLQLYWPTLELLIAHFQCRGRSECTKNHKPFTSSVCSRGWYQITVWTNKMKIVSC